MKNKAVFLDRDGTLNRDVGYPSSFNVIEIYPFSFTAVKMIKEAGFLAVIITNQSGIGRGLIREENLLDIHARLSSEFRSKGAAFDAIHYCPHHANSEIPEYRQECACRKPNPGMGLKAATDLNIDTSQSYMIGDKIEDILFGINIQAKPILVLTGYGRESQKALKDRGIKPAHVAMNVLDAAKWIVEREARVRGL